MSEPGWARLVKMIMMICFQLIRMLFRTLKLKTIHQFLPKIVLLCSKHFNFLRFGLFLTSIKERPHVIWKCNLILYFISITKVKIINQSILEIIFIKESCNLIYANLSNLKKLENPISGHLSVQNLAMKIFPNNSLSIFSFHRLGIKLIDITSLIFTIFFGKPWKLDSFAIHQNKFKQMFLFEVVIS